MIAHPLIEFWLKFIYSNASSFKQVNPKIIDLIKNDINSYVGRKFENVCKEYLQIIKPINFTSIARQWGKFNGEKGKNTYEIDLVAINERNKEILFCECKWQENVNAEKILSELKEKAKYVQWQVKNRNEHFCIIAKSFNKKLKKDECLCVDLEDLEKAFSI